MEPFIGQIMMFGGNFAPRGWALCDGQLLDIASHSALFSILGTTYGGDGRSNFALPDLRGRLPMHVGQGKGLSPRVSGQHGGVEEVVLSTQQIPSHNHDMTVSGQKGSIPSPVDHVIAAGVVDNSTKTPLADFAPYPKPANETLDTRAITQTGGGQGHDNMPPFQCVTFVIALTGLFPSRN